MKLLILLLVGVFVFSSVPTVEASYSKSRMCRNAKEKKMKELRKITDFNSETERRLTDPFVGNTYWYIYNSRELELSKLRAKVDARLVKLNKDIKRYCK
jgi:hypothetical protein